MKRLYIIALFVFASGFASAQENGNRDAQNRIVRGPYETNRFFDNIFVGVAGGVNLYFGENDSEGKFGKRLAPAMDIHVGKWFTPSIGARVGYAGLQAKGWTTAGTLYAKSADGGLFREKFGVMYLHADAMWNFSNAVSGYKESRTWNFVPFVGVGWARSYGNDAHDNEIGFDAGLLNVVRPLPARQPAFRRCDRRPHRRGNAFGDGRPGLQVQPPRLRARLERAAGGRYALSRPDSES